MKRILIAAALAAIPATGFAQSVGPVIRDPTGGGVTRDPALAGQEMYSPFGSPPLARDPAGGTMISDEAGFRDYVMTQRVRSYRYAEPVEVGTVLPSRGIMYRQVPAEFGAPGYRYTIINDQPVIVEPRTRRVIDVID
ncbi:DUF1236 domain-containing protein [Bosea thiooxidans]